MHLTDTVAMCVPPQSIFDHCRRKKTRVLDAVCAKRGDTSERARAAAAIAECTC